MLRCTIFIGTLLRAIVIKIGQIMRRPDPPDHTAPEVPKRPSPNAPDRAPLTAWLPVLAAVGIMATGCLSTFLVLQLDEFRPKLGDIVAFRQQSPDTDLWQTAIPVILQKMSGTATRECSLDPSVMAEKGGSLVVEGRQDEPSLQYQIHWQGSATARTSEDCGSSANLLVSRTDLQRLANAAGGFGIGDKGMTR